MPGRKEIAPGERYGRLTVIKFAGHSGKNRGALWLCRCDCGTETLSRGTDLRSGKKKSCGCLQREIAKATVEKYIHSPEFKLPDNTKHGLHDTRLFSIWCCMKVRCYNKNSTHYKYYGGKGVTICSEWLNDFKAFYDWAMSNGYKDCLTIDRIDNNGNYCPGNCRWITHNEQILNRSNTVYVEYNGERKPLAVWCRMYGVNYKTAHAKYRKGLPPEVYLTPTQKGEQYKR